MLSNSLHHLIQIQLEGLEKAAADVAFHSISSRAKSALISVSEKEANWKSDNFKKQNPVALYDLEANQPSFSDI